MILESDSNEDIILNLFNDSDSVIYRNILKAIFWKGITCIPFLFNCSSFYAGFSEM